jgi:sialate O-acetylesterase
MPRWAILPVLALGWQVGAQPLLADVRPHALICEGMVLQQQRDVPLWGTAAPGERVKVEFRRQQAETLADQSGRWSVTVPSGAAGGPFPLTISGRNTLAFHRVLVGEVWLCSGQSNMGWPFAPRPGSKILAGTENDLLRLFTVPQRLADAPQTDLAEGEWLDCGPDTVGKFSAVAYHFGKDLQQALDVPLGLIHASYGGSSAWSWLNPAAPLEAELDTDVKRMPSVLHNGMIAPLVPYGIRGAVWYQGEADTRAASQYQELFTSLIKGWRSEWKQGDFPFLFVQLAPYDKIVSQPQESDWAELREAQRIVSLTVPQSAMAVITDCGHETDIHPQPKRPVGERLALSARALVYGHQVVSSGPSLAGMKLAEDTAILEFAHCGGGLEARQLELEDIKTNARSGQTGGALHAKKRDPADGAAALQGFAVAGEDGRFFNATAEIRGNLVLVKSTEVRRPVAVRYGWADYPTGNLFNHEGLPASPFQTGPVAPR